MPDNKKLNELIIKIKNKDTKALSELYNLTNKDIFAFIFSIVKHYYDAEDIMHNVYITIYKNSYLYIESNNPKSWIFTIAKNETLMKIRKNKKETQITNEDLEKIGKLHVELNHEDKILIKHMLNDLNEDERKIIIMHDMSGFKHKEIALILNLPLPTVLSKYHRSIKKMKAFLKEEL